MRYNIFPMVRAPLISAGILYGVDYLTDKNRYDWKQTLMDVGALFAGHLAAQVIANFIPNFITGPYGTLFDSASMYLLQPVVGAILYDYLYNSLRDKYPYNGSTMRNQLENYTVASLTIAASNIVECKLFDWIM